MTSPKHRKLGYKPFIVIPSKSPNRRGFALVVTLTLMVLLTILALGLLSLSTISLRSTNEASGMQTARANARMAMMLAIGRLQNLSGTDRVITASAGTGILSKSDLALGSKSSSSAIRHYVGVWEAAKNPRDSAGKFDFKKPVYPNNGRMGEATLFKGWLVSNAGTDKMQDQTFFDGVTSVDKIPFDEVKVGGSNPAVSVKPVYLVHDGSVDHESGYVKAGTVPLVKKSSSGAASPGGRYAYWVGDNNQKFFVNPRDLKLRENTAVASGHLLKMATPGPYGAEAFAGISKADGGFTIAANTEKSDRIITTKTLQIANGLDVARKNFHDITTVADSVLANVTSGGLRKDLSLFFEGDPESGSWEGYKRNGNAPTGPYGQQALSNYNEYDTAPWSLLRQYSKLPVASSVIHSQNGSANGVVAPDAKNTSQFSNKDYPGWNRQRAHINPVILRAGMILAVGATNINTLPNGNFRRPISEGNYPPKFNGLVPVKDPSSPADNPTFIRNNYLLNFSAYPVVTIWNPYNVPMELPGFWMNINGTGTEQVVSVQGAARPVSFHWGVASENNGVSTSRTAGRGLYYRQAFTLEPGETRTFAADIKKTPSLTRAMYFEAIALSKPSDLDALITASAPWNGGFLLNAPDQTKNADHDNRDFYNDPNVTYSMMGSTTGIFADASSLIEIENREFRPAGMNGTDTKPGELGHQGLVNYEIFSSFEVSMFATNDLPTDKLWFSWSRQNESSKHGAKVAWRSDEGNPVTIAADLGTGPFQIPPFQMSTIINGQRRPFMSIDLRLKSAENFGAVNRQLNPNCTWLHNIPQFPYTGLTDRGVRKSLGESIGADEIKTAALGHPYTMRYFSTPNFTDFFTTVHPMELFGGHMVPYVGRSYSFSGGSDAVGQRRMVAAEIPVAPLQSIAQLTHLPMVPIDASRWSNFGLQNMAIANSYANPLLDADAIIFPKSHPSPSNSSSWSGWKTWLDLEQNKSDNNWKGFPDLDGFGWVPIHGGSSFDNQFIPMRFVDRSYVANTLLWDDFFFSGLANYDTKYLQNLGAKAVTKNQMIDQFVIDGEPLPNATFHLTQRGIEKPVIASDLKGQQGYKKTATYMTVKGGFNVNSLSVKAWKAFLSANLKKRIPVVQPSGQAHPLARFEESTADQYAISRFTAPLETTGNPESKWTEYNVVDDDDLNDLAEKIVAEVTARGPFRSISEFVNRRVAKGSSNPEFAVKGALQAALDKSSINEDLVDSSHMISSSDLSGTSYAFPEAAQQSHYAGSPEYVMQSDILQSIGSVIQARSDSFIIRAYGESADGQSKAWCEAQVTRSIDYVDPSDDPEKVQADLNPVNQAFGRRYRVVSFRWLSPDEV